MKKGDILIDYTYPTIEGVIEECKDLHNVFVRYTNTEGTGLYCLDPDCKENDIKYTEVKDGRKEN